MSANVGLEIADAVMVVTLDRPPVNALDRPTLAELTEVFAGVRGSREVNCVVLTAAGDRAFCAGVDLNDSVSRYRPHDRAAGPPDAQLDPGRAMREMFWAVYECVVPVIAAVNGPAIGAGLALASVCDVIIASDNARFALTEIDVGVLGGASHAQRLAGPYLARRMFFTGQAVDPRQLEALGTVHAVVPRGELLAEAMSLARVVAAKSPIALRLAKEAFGRVEALPLKDAYRLEQDYTEKLRTYDDSAEAGSAYREKRDPEWRWH
jgi:enoyl-CoA hydratase